MKKTEQAGGATTRKVRLLHDVRGDYPIGHHVVATAGVYVPHVNPQGAVSVIASDGKLLGIKPGEFEWVGTETPAGAQLGTCETDYSAHVGEHKYRADCTFWEPVAASPSDVQRPQSTGELGTKRNSAPHVGKCGFCGSDNICEHDLMAATAAESDSFGMAEALEIKDLRKWKDSAMVQLGKAQRLMDLLPMLDYLGWDVYDGTVDYINKLQSGDSVQRRAREAADWISVKDAMPEYGTAQIVHGFSKDHPELSYIEMATYSYTAGWHVGYDGDNDYTVTHWMPLPTPPGAAHSASQPEEK